MHKIALHPSVDMTFSGHPGDTLVTGSERWDLCAKCLDPSAAGGFQRTPEPSHLDDLRPVAPGHGPMGPTWDLMGPVSFGQWKGVPLNEWLVPVQGPRPLFFVGNSRTFLDQIQFFASALCWMFQLEDLGWHTTENDRIHTIQSSCQAWAYP